MSLLAMTVMHINHGRSWRQWVVDHLTRHGWGDEDGQPMRFGCRVRFNQDAHQIRLTLSWRAALMVGVTVVGILLGAAWMGQHESRQLLLSTLSTEQVQAMPAQPNVLNIAAEAVGAAERFD